MPARARAPLRYAVLLCASFAPLGACSSTRQSAALHQVDELSDLCGGGGPVSFGEDHDGELYVVCLGGTIYRIDAAAP